VACASVLDPQRPEHEPGPRRGPPSRKDALAAKLASDLAPDGVAAPPRTAAPAANAAPPALPLLGVDEGVPRLLVASDLPGLDRRLRVRVRVFGAELVHPLRDQLILAPLLLRLRQATKL